MEECEICLNKIAEIEKQLLFQLKVIRFGLIFEAAFLGLIAGLVLGIALR